MDLFGAAHGWGVKKSPLPKNCRTYPTKMKLGAVIPYLKNTQKIHKSRDRPHEFCAFFDWKSVNFAILENANIQIYNLVHNF